MIYTLTANPALDMVERCHGLVANAVNRTYDASYNPNGKGLNVSYTLKHYGVDSVIMGFFGGFTGDFIVNGAQQRGCRVRPVYVDGITRVNVSINDGTNEYHFPNEGCVVPRDRQMQLLNLIDDIDDLECLVISGSLPPQVAPRFYDEVIDRVKAKGADFVLDISIPMLADLVRKRPLLIKPNDDELATIFGVDVSSEAAMGRALMDICGMGAQNVLLTLGGDGALFCDGVHLWKATSPKVKVLSTVCAGDATLGAFLSLWGRDRGAVEPALRRAMATGANVAMSAGLGDFAAVDELASLVEVHEVEL